MWMEHCKILLNEYRLNPARKEDQQVIVQQMEQYFFGEGAALPKEFVPPSPVEIAPRGRGGLQPGVGELFTHLSSRTEQMHRETMHLRSRGTPGQSARIRTASQDRASTSRTECRGGCIASQFRRRGLTPVKSLARLISPQILHPADNILTFSMSHFRHPTCHTGSRETCAQLLATSYQLLATGLPAL